MKRKLMSVAAVFGILVLILVCFLIAGCAQDVSEPEVEWDKTFGGTDFEYVRSVQQTQDGGYVIVGSTASFGAGDYDAWLIKTDSEGNKLWNKTFGGSGADEGYSVQQTQDGGYIVAGRTGSYGAGDYDVWLIKTDSEGNELWDKTFGGSGADEGYSVQQTQDRGYIVAGWTSTSSLGEGMQGWLIKTDSDGKKSWDKTLGGSDGDVAFVATFPSLQQTRDGGYIIAGVAVSPGDGNWDVWLERTDSSGNRVWDKTFGGSGLEMGCSVQQTEDGGYIIAAYVSPSGDSNYDAWLIKTDSDGNKVWDKTFGGSESDAFLSVQQTQDGGYIIAGMTGSFGAGEDDIWLVKTDSEGNRKWDRTFGGSEQDAGFSVQQTQDGGYIIAGMTASCGAGEDDIWLIKTSG